MKGKKILQRISDLVFKRDPDNAFENFYQPKELKEEEVNILPENMWALLNPDSSGMTCLQRAVYLKQTEVVALILQWIVLNYFDETDPEANELAKNVVYDVTCDYGCLAIPFI